MTKERIGENAGVVWRMLHGSNDGETLEGISLKTGLDIPEAAAAIGWLARENQIMIQEKGSKTYYYTVYHEHYY